MSEPAAFQQAFALVLAQEGAPVAMFADPAMARALAVHRNTSARAAHDALAANFPVVRALVGEDSFAGLASAFVTRRPPTDPRLCFYGEGLAEFVADYAPFSQAPYLGDVAALERLFTEALFAADAEPLDLASFLSALDLDARLILHPAVRLADFVSPAASIWLAHQPGAPADALETLTWREETALISRPGLSVQVAVIDAAATAFLKACQRGATLAEAALAVSALDTPVSSVITTLISAGALCARLH